MEKTEKAVEVQGAETANTEKKALNKKAKRIAAKKAAKIEAAKLLEISKAAEAEKENTPPVAEEKPKKKKKSDKETLKDQSANDVVATITQEKELKYIYPEDCSVGKTKLDILEKRKKFRAGVRRKVASFENQVLKAANALEALESAEKKDKKAISAQKAGLKELETTYKAYANEVYVKGELQPA